MTSTVHVHAAPPRTAARARGCAAIALLVALGYPANARAADGEGAIYSGIASAMVLMVRTAELSVPDVRWEHADGQSDWIMSWPIALAGPHRLLGDHHALALTPFAELQRHRGRDALRLLAGGRATFYDRRPAWQWAPLIEVGALAGEDGRGAFVGAGVGYGLPEVGVTLGLLGRRVWTDEGVRTDVALDFQIPLALRD